MFLSAVFDFVDGSSLATIAILFRRIRKIKKLTHTERMLEKNENWEKIYWERTTRIAVNAQVLILTAFFLLLYSTHWIAHLSTLVFINYSSTNIYVSRFIAIYQWVMFSLLDDVCLVSKTARRDEYCSLSLSLSLSSLFRTVMRTFCLCVSIWRSNGDWVSMSVRFEAIRFVC